MTLYYEQPKIKINISTKKVALMESFVKHLTRISPFNLAHSYKDKQKTVFSLKLPALMFLCILSTGAEAANWYIRPNSSTYGTGTGQNWTNAWSGFSKIPWSTVSCGDTLWVAGGTYTETLSLQKNCTSAAKLNIRRARSDAPESTGAAGWSSGFDSTVNHVGSSGSDGIMVDAGVTAAYITISGRTVASGGSNGWYINFTATNGGNGIDFVDTSKTSNIIFEYIDNVGPGYINYPSGGRGLDLTPYNGSCSNNTFSHMKISDWESGAYNAWCNGSIYENIEMYNIMPQNWSQWHPNGIYIQDSNNGIVRNSKFYKKAYGVGEGIFFTNAMDNWKIYGNLFYDLDQSGWKAIELIAPVTNLKIWNNVFDNVLVGPMYIDASRGGCGAGSEYKNNLSFSGSASCGTTSNNLTTTSSSVVVNKATKDYHIVSTVGSGYPRSAGADLSAYFTSDADGTPFSGGTWDIGAYAYSTGVTAIPPQPPAISLQPPSGLKTVP